MAGRGRYLREKRSQGWKVAAVWPARFPVELLWAGGFCAAEIWDPPVAPARAPAHLQPFVCSVVRSGFELLASGGMEVADLLAFSHTCDSLQNLSTMVEDLLGEPRPILNFYPPKGSASAAGERYTKAQIQELWSRVKELVPEARDEALQRAAQRGLRRVGLLRRLYAARAEGRLACTNEEFYDTVRACEYLLPEDAVARLEALLARSAGQAGVAPKLVFSGVLPTPKDLMSRLDEMGVRVVDDDLLACGRRVPRSAIPESPDPVEALAKRHRALPPCSTQGAPLEERAAFLRELVEGSGAQGVVFLSLKFCEPDLFERPNLVEAMRKEGIPALVLETETGAETSAGLMTRLEAFLEGLS
jgi:benzoyl-CoA reductase/2-hydroxyglutaryl-CoA dehydratase subunit BcrC/BadD/HgdB